MLIVFIKLCYLCIYLKTISSLHVLRIRSARASLPVADIYRACSGRSPWSQPDAATPPQHRMHPAQQLQKQVCLVHTRARELGNKWRGYPCSRDVPNAPPAASIPGFMAKSIPFQLSCNAEPTVSRHFFTLYSAAKVPRYGKATSIGQKGQQAVKISRNY